MADNAFKISDSTIPTIMIKVPENNIIASEQYDTPLIYHVYFDDETELKEINFTADSIDLGDVTADVNINKVTDTEYVLSLSNIVGESGAHHITLKEGIAKDIVNNETKSVEAKKFYLYNKESDIDNESPKINFTQFKIGNIYCKKIDISLLGVVTPYEMFKTKEKFVEKLQEKF